MKINQITAQILAAVGGAAALPGALPSFSNEFDGARHAPGNDIAITRGRGIYPPSFDAYARTRLSDLPDVCMVFNADDSRNCMLGPLPYGDTWRKSVATVVSAGCSESLPDDTRSTLEATGRTEARLRADYLSEYKKLLRGDLSVRSLETRLSSAIASLPTNVQRALQCPGVKILQPRTFYQPFAFGAHEIARHNLPQTENQFPTAGPRGSRTGLLGAYLQTTIDDQPRAFIVTLSTREDLITEIPLSSGPNDWPENPVFSTQIGSHWFRRSELTMGDPPNNYRISLDDVQFVRRPIFSENLAHTLAELLHQGARRYYTIATMPSREQFAPQSHAHIKQELCDAGTFDGMSAEHRRKRFAALENWMDAVERNETAKADPGNVKQH